MRQVGLGRWPHHCRFPLVLARWGGSVAVEILPEYHSLLVQKAGMERVLLPYRTFSASVNISSSQEGASLMSRLARPLPARTRRQVVEQVAPRYREASFAQKILLLDAVVEASGYARKYAITLLNQPTERPLTIQQHPPFTSARSEVLQALFFAWNVANWICAKRLIPFLPTLIDALERHGHLHLTEESRNSPPPGESRHR